MSFQDIKDTGNGELRWRFVIEGYRTQFVSAYDMERTIGVVQWQRRVGLIADSIRFAENVILTEGRLEASSMTVRINDVEGEATAAFMTKPTKVGRLLSNLTDTTSDIEIENAADFADDSVVFIGGECIRLGIRTANTFQLSVRRYRDTIARYHYATTELGIPLNPYVEDAWRSPQQRRCFIYAYGKQDDPQGDGILVWQGIVKTGNTIQGDMLSYEIDAEPVSSIFETDFGSEDAKNLMLRGYHFPTGYPWTLKVYESYPLTGSTPDGITSKSWTSINDPAIDGHNVSAWQRSALLSGTGFYESLGDISIDLNRQMEAEAITAGFITRPNFFLPVNDPTRMAFGFQSVGNRVCKIVATTGYPFAGQTAFVGPEQGTEAYKEYQATTTYAETGLRRPDENDAFTPAHGFQQFTLAYPYEVSAIGELALSSVRNLPIMSGSGQYAFVTCAPWPDATNIYVSRTGGRGRTTGSAEVTADPSNRWYLTGDPLDTDGVSTWNVKAYMPPPGIQAAEDHLKEARISYESMEPTNQSLLISRLEYINRGGWIEPPTNVNLIGRDCVELMPSLEIVATGSFYHFMSGIVALSPRWSGLGVLPPLTASMFNLDEISSSLARLPETAIVHRRNYRILTSDENLGEYIAEELKLINHMPKLDTQGRWSIAPISYASQAEAIYAINETNHLTDKGFGSYEQNDEGIRNQGVLKTGWSFVENEHEGTEFKIKWPQSKLRYNGKSKTHSIGPMSSETQPVTAREAYDVLWRPLSLFGQDYETLSVEVPFTLFDAVIGTPVTLTSLAFPNGQGERGITRRAARVVGREMSSNGYGRLSLMASSNEYDGYSPSLRIISGTMTPNGLTGTFFVERFRYAISGVQDASYFPVGTQCGVISYAMTGSDPFSINSSFGTVSFTLLDIAGLTSSVVVRFASPIHGQLTGGVTWSQTGQHRFIYTPPSMLLDQTQGDGFAKVQAKLTGSGDYFGP